MLPDMFFTIGFSLSIFVSTAAIVLSLVIIFIVIRNREFHTINNVLICNTCVGACLFYIISIVSFIYGFREDWALNAPLCSLRGYFYTSTIVVITHSKSIQAISRLFNAILYKQKYLLTWRTHWIIIILNWILAFLVCIPPLFFEGGYALEEQSRICVGSCKIYPIGLYIAIVACILPSIIINTIYIRIVSYVHQSTLRVQAMASTNNQNTIHTAGNIRKAKRELRLVKQMTVQMGLLGSAGIFYIVVIIWQATQQQPPPEVLYLSARILITICISAIPFVQFILNEQLKKFALRYFSPQQASTTVIKMVHRPQQAWYIT